LAVWAEDIGGRRVVEKEGVGFEDEIDVVEELVY
jgi:hypothetical protein